MAFVRLRFALLSSLLFGALCTGCGGDGDDDEQQGDTAGASPPGCYIEASHACDCALDEMACSEDVGIWVEMGCGTCQM